MVALAPAPNVYETRVEPTSAHSTAVTTYGAVTKIVNASWGVDAPGNVGTTTPPELLPFAGPQSPPASHAELAQAFSERKPITPEPEGELPLPDDMD